MAPMMACRTLAMPLTMAIRQLPIVRKMASICLLSDSDSDSRGDEILGLRIRTYARYDGTHFECVCLFVFLCLFGLL